MYSPENEAKVSIRIGRDTKWLEAWLTLGKTRGQLKLLQYKDARLTVGDVLRPGHDVVRPVELAEDDAGLGERLADMVDCAAHALLPPGELLGRERNGEAPLGLVVLEPKESLRTPRKGQSAPPFSRTTEPGDDAQGPTCRCAG